MAHKWGELPAEGPIARRLRLLQERTADRCGHCGIAVDRRVVYLALLGYRDVQQRAAFLCEGCGRKLAGWLEGEES